MKKKIKKVTFIKILRKNKSYLKSMEFMKINFTMMDIKIQVIALRHINPLIKKKLISTQEEP